MNHKSKVLIISHLWPGNPQSSNPLSGIYVYEQVEELRKLIEVKVLVPVSIFPKMKEMILNPSSAYKKILKRSFYKPNNEQAVKYLPLFGKHINAFIIAIKISKECKQYSVIHAHTLFPDGLSACIASAITKTPFVVTVHGSEVMLIDNKPVNKIIAGVIAKRAKAVISVSEKMKIKLERISGAHINAVVVRNGIKTMFNMTDESKTFLFVGKLTDIKDPGILIDAFAKFNIDVNEFNLVLVGGGELKREMEEKIFNTGLKEKVHFAGFVDRERIGEYYSKAHSLIISSKSEGFPTVIFEAMSAGLPIISFDVGGVKEVVEEGKTGYIASGRSIDELYSAMKRSAKTCWDRKYIRSKASDYTYSKIVLKLQDIYSSIK